MVFKGLLRVIHKPCGKFFDIFGPSISLLFGTFYWITMLLYVMWSFGLPPPPFNVHMVYGWPPILFHTDRGPFTNYVDRFLGFLTLPLFFVITIIIYIRFLTFGSLPLPHDCTRSLSTIPLTISIRGYFFCEESKVNFHVFMLLA